MATKQYFLFSYEYWETCEPVPKKDYALVLAQNEAEALNELYNSHGGIIKGTVVNKTLETPE